MVTTQLRDGELFYMIAVAPENEAGVFQNAFRNMMQVCSNQRITANHISSRSKGPLFGAGLLLCQPFAISYGPMDAITIQGRTWFKWTLIAAGWTLFAVFFASESVVSRAYMGRPLRVSEALGPWLLCAYIWLAATPCFTSSVASISA